MRRLSTILVAGGFMLAALMYASDPVLAAGTLSAPLPGTKLTTTLITGVDRYDTAIRVSQAGFSQTAPAVVITRGDSYPDALCSAPLAHAYGGPLLLTPLAGLTPGLVTELERLHPAMVFLVGLGNSSGQVAKQVSGVLPGSNVTTLAGKDRYETAALVAKAVAARTGTPSTVVIAPGDSFPDALAVAPLAAARNWPILYTPQNGSLPAVTEAALRDLNAQSALEVGTRVPTGLADVTRIVGADRYETSLGIVEYASAQGLSAAHIAFVRGDNYPDGIASGPYLALDGGILLLTDNGKLTALTEGFLQDNRDSLQNVEAIGLSSMPKGTWLYRNGLQVTSITPATEPKETPTNVLPPTTPTTVAPPTTPTTVAPTTTTTVRPTTTTTVRPITTTTVRPTTTTAVRWWWNTTTTVRPTTTTAATVRPTTLTTAPVVVPPATTTTLPWWWTTTTTVAPTTTTVRPTTTIWAPATTTTTSPPNVNPASFNLQNAINAAPSGGTVNIPAGTITLSSMVRLKSGISLVGVPGQTVLSSSVNGWMVYGSGVSNVSMSGIALRGPGSGSDTSGIALDGATGIRFSNMTFQGLHYGLKIGSGPQSSGISADALVFTHSAEPLFLANVSNSNFSSLDIQADRYDTNLWHGIYLERDSHNLTFSNVRITGGSGYSLQLYTESGASSGISFDGLSLDATSGRYPLVIWGWSSVTFRNVTMTMPAGVSYSVVRLHGTASNVVFDGFTASGGNALVSPYSGQSPSGVTFRNGTYQGPNLGSGASFENVIRN